VVAQRPAPWPARKRVASRTITSPITSEYHARRIDIRQNTVCVCTVCESHEPNVQVLDRLGLLNGVLNNALNGKGSPDAQ
jgi:hypothetical protein